MTDIRERLEIKYPVFQGGMANIADGRFAAAVSNAGGLGIIAGGGMDPAGLEENIRLCRSLTGKPFGVNIMLMHPAAGEMAAIAARERVPVVTTGAGNPAKYMDSWKAAGCMVFPVVPSAALARRMEKAGADGVIAEGTESGGHVGELTTMALVPQVADAVSIPVIGNGDCIDLPSVMKMYEYTKCDLVMIGRGALGSPWIFRQVDRYLTDGTVLPDPSLPERMQVMLRHIKLICENKGESGGMREARKHAAWYMKGMRGAPAFRKQSGELCTYADAEKLAADVLARNG